MSLRISVCVSTLLVVGAIAPVTTGQTVPFRGVWEGSTDSAELVPGETDVVFVVSSGSGQATHLGRFEMTTPHFSFLDTFELEGEQNFTAANGDQLFADFAGELMPNAEGNLEGVLGATITGGTGRFRHASGSYDFHLIARLADFGFDSTAVIWGQIRLGKKN